MLLLEKVIKLLDDYHYGVFREKVKNLSKRSYYPLVLVDLIDRDFLKEQDSDRLCRDVYGAHDEKTRRKFFQLAHHTFRLTALLARDHPDYLLPNIPRIRRLLNEGKLEAANRLADMLYEVCRKVEDYTTERKLLEMQSRQNLLLDLAFFAHEQHNRIGELNRIECKLQELVGRLWHFLHPPSGEKSAPSSSDLEDFAADFEHPATAVRLLSRFAWAALLPQADARRFRSPETGTFLLDLESEFEKFGHIVLPGLVDYPSELRILRLLHLLETSAPLEEILDLPPPEPAAFWNSFARYPLADWLFHLTGHLAKACLAAPHPETRTLLRERLRTLGEQCDALLRDERLEQLFIQKFLALSIARAFTRLAGGPEEWTRTREHLERLLWVYQQVPFHQYLDAIYFILAYCGLKLEDYPRVEEYFRRFRKVLKSKEAPSAHSLLVEGLYYLAQLRNTGRPQYARKLQRLSTCLEARRLRVEYRLLEREASTAPL